MAYTVIECYLSSLAAIVSVHGLEICDHRFGPELNRWFVEGKAYIDVHCRTFSTQISHLLWVFG